MTDAGALPGGPRDKDIRDLARGTVVNLVGTVARASRFLAVVVATNLFGSATYGLYDAGWKIAFVFALSLIHI